MSVLLCLQNNDEASDEEHAATDDNVAGEWVGE